MKTTNVSEIIIKNTLEICLVFDCSGLILSANKAAEKKLGYPKGMRGIPIEQILLQEAEREEQTDAVVKYDRIARNINERKETVCYRKNKTCFIAAARCVREGDVYYLFASNIGSYREMQKELRMVQEKARLAETARNEFVANVTHELRTPVNGIRGHIENLKETSLTTEQRKTLDIMESCCNTMSALINNILDFAKLEAGKVELDAHQFEFREQMDKLIAAHMPAVNEKGLQLSVNIDENIPRCLIGDEVRISQVLNNLISNAIKFTSLGFVKVEVTQTMRMGDEIELFFMVADSGIGIGKEEQDKLFKSFSQVDASVTRRYGGTGLGLVISKQLVEMMNGRMYLESEKGKGSNFSFSVRLHVLEDDRVLLEYKKEIEDFMENIRKRYGGDDPGESYQFGSQRNREEVQSRMEKLVLCIELNAWEKAEIWIEELKKLTEYADDTIRRALLKLGMSVRKEDYDSSIRRYEELKALLEE